MMHHLLLVGLSLIIAILPASVQAHATLAGKSPGSWVAGTTSPHHSSIANAGLACCEFVRRNGLRKNL